MLKAFLIKCKYFSKIRFLAYRFVVSVRFCLTPLLLLDWLHDCTDVDEAQDQNGGEIDEAPTCNSPGPPPEAGGTVAGRPKAT